MTDKPFPDLQLAFEALHLISINRKPHTTIDETVEMFRHVLEEQARARDRQPEIPPLPEGKVIAWVNWDNHPAAIMAKSDGGIFAVALFYRHGWKEMDLGDFSDSDTVIPENSFNALAASFLSRKPWEAPMPRKFAKWMMAEVLEEERKEEEYQASLNPKGVPIIFPGYD